MHYKIIDTSQILKWEEYLVQLPKLNLDIYITPKYYQIYEMNEEGKAYCFIYSENEKVIIYPFLLNSVNSLGYKLNNNYYDIQGAYGYNGPIYNSNQKSFIERFYIEFKNFCKNNNIIAEYTRFHPIIKNHLVSNDYFNVLLNRATVYIDLKDSYENIWNNHYTSKNRNMIRKAHKLGYHINISYNPSETDINTFIEIYTNTMKRVNAEKYYFFNNNFFNNTFQFLNKSSLLVNVLNSENNIISSSIFLESGVFLNYHLSGRTEHSDNSANNFLIDEMVKYGQVKGLSYFHLGGGITNDENDPLFKFKTSFSKNINPFYIGKKVHNEEIYNSVCEQWENNYPNMKPKYNQRLLKYREIEK